MADVLIIGAGVAGLAAASALLRAGMSVQMLEARDRIGGRIWTQHDSSFPAPVELGAEFIHGKPREIWSIVESRGLAVTEVPQDHFMAPRTRIDSRRDMMDEIERATERLRRERNCEQSIAEVLKTPQSDPTLRRLGHSLEAYVSNFHAADVSRFSIRALLQSADAAEEVEGDRAFRLVRGYDQITAEFEEQLKQKRVTLRLRTIVKRIHWARGRVRLSAGSGATWIARAALITLPLGVLQAAASARAAVEFQPALPQKQAAIGRMAMGHTFRIVLRFRERFWENTEPAETGVSREKMETFSFLHGLELPIPVWWSTRPLIAPVLTGWIGGPAAEQLAGRSEKWIVKQACESLARVFHVNEREVKKQLLDWHYHDWTSDPFSRGAYSYMPVGGRGAAEELAAPVERTLFFAGEATEVSGHNATVHGAIRTGIRAAQQILNAVG
jgi:monoamine oxidase